VSAYLTAVLADNPIHYWRCADPGGALAHDIGSVPRHQAMTNPETNPLGYSGPISDGGSLFGTGNSGRSNTGVAVPSYGTAYTFECWFWLFRDDTSPGNIMSNQSVSALGWNSATGWTWNGGGGVASSLTNYTLRAWHHLVGSVDGTSAILYVDGTQRATAAGHSASPSDLVYFQENSSGTGVGQGGIAEAAIYNAKLSSTRVGVHFAAGDQVFQDPVYQLAGGVPGGLSAAAPYLGLLQQILQSVRHAV
jgi:hypothetical protein